MLSIAHSGMPLTALERIRHALPAPLLVGVPSIGDIGGAARQGHVNLAIVGQEVLTGAGCHQLSALKARHPYLATVAYLDPRDQNIGRLAYLCGHANCDAVVLGGMEDHPAGLRVAIETAGVRAVAFTICSWSTPIPEIMTPVSVEVVLRNIRTMRRTRALATAMGCTLGELRDRLHQSGLFQPLLLLAWLRQLAAARLLCDTPMTVEQVGLAVGYSSATAFHKSSRAFVGATPAEIREHGGLRYAAQVYRRAVGDARAGDDKGIS